MYNYKGTWELTIPVARLINIGQVVIRGESNCDVIKETYIQQELDKA